MRHRKIADRRPLSGANPDIEQRRGDRVGSRLLHLLTAGIGTSRPFAVTQQSGRFHALLPRPDRVRRL